jgi:hydrogenase expression/formation protein HypC
VCLAVPGKVVDIRDDGPLRQGKVAFGPITKDVCLAYVPEAEVGDYVIVHVGFAISRVDEEEAQKVFAYLDEIGELET